LGPSQRFQTIELYLDEDINISLAAILRGHGYDVITTLEVGNLSNLDEEQLEYAANNSRAILRIIGNTSAVCIEIGKVGDNITEESSFLFT
jgi:hypothetical protein